MYITVALRGHNVSGSQLLYTNPQVGVGVGRCGGAWYTPARRCVGQASRLGYGCMAHLALLRAPARCHSHVVPFAWLPPSTPFAAQRLSSTTGNPPLDVSSSIYIWTDVLNITYIQVRRFISGGWQVRVEAYQERC